MALDSPVHRLDSRVKIALLGAYTASLFFIDTWVGMGLAALLFAFALKLSCVPARRVFGLAVPVYVLVGFAVLFNAFVFATPEMIEARARASRRGTPLRRYTPLRAASPSRCPG